MKHIVPLLACALIAVSGIRVPLNPSSLNPAALIETSEDIVVWSTQSKGEGVDELYGDEENSDNLEISKDEYGEYYVTDIPDHDDGTEIPEVVSIYQDSASNSTITSGNYTSYEEEEDLTEARAAYATAQSLDEDDRIEGVYETYEYSVQMSATEFKVDVDDDPNTSLDASNLEADYDTDDTQEYTYVATSDEAVYLDTNSESAPDVVVYEDEDEDPVYNVLNTYEGMNGDLYDNEDTESTPLHLAVPKEDSSETTWRSIDMDEDTEEFVEDVDESDNPAGSILIQSTEEGLTSESSVSGSENTLDRDEEDLPDDVDDAGDDMGDGETIYILVTTFEEDEVGSGKLWVIPEDSDDRDEGYVLISGLSTPTGACFDINNDLLYVVDPGYSDNGYIFQYEIDWDDDGDQFELKNDKYAVIYEGGKAYDCAVDKYGNLFFVVKDLNQLNMVNYLDLWSGQKNLHYTIYDSSDQASSISAPTSLDIYEDDDIYFVNSNQGSEKGVLVYAEAESKYLNDGEIRTLVRENWAGLSVAVSEDYAYFTTDDGTLYAFDLEDEDTLYIKTQGFFGKPIGLCYGDDYVYIADYARDRIYRVDDDDDTEEPENWVKIPGPYSVHCVNSSASLILSAILFILILF